MKCKKIKKFISKYKGEICGLCCFLIMFVLPFSLLFWHCSNLQKDPQWRLERQRNYIDFQRTHPPAGKLVTTKDGLKGTVTRECWMGYNRYEVRLSDGTITYVNGKDFK
jgi:hypothetical protein